VIVGAVYAWRKLRNAEGRRALAAWAERQGKRPLLRPFAALLVPVWHRLLRPVVMFLGTPVRFLWNRLTPGHLGLELTSVLAASAVGSYVFVAYASMVSDDPGATPWDRQLLELGDDVRNSTAVSLMKVVTQLGSPATVATMAFGVSVVLLLRRHVMEAVAFVAGVLLVYLAVRLFKEGIQRPRPPGPLVSAQGSSFPSGHAAYSTIWVAAAVAVGWCMPGIGRRSLLIGAALALAVVVGLSRIYLRVHYWSDVAAGWGLGAGMLGAAGAAALTVAFIRQNEHGRAASDTVSWPP
jgi:membrane-associated phospholipid phosphatase